MPRALNFWLNTGILFAISIAMGLVIIVGEKNQESDYLWVKLLGLILLAVMYASWIFKKFFRLTLKDFIRYLLLMLLMGIAAVCIFSVAVVKLIGL
ncbi:hypothetical protein ACIGHN_24580 [Acidovorax sp. NPDC077693]|uniref:hypothetical protein n=1 Tax=unclassified Acidovorax TaxID=2684926 RepID=UPI0037C685E5